MDRLVVKPLRLKACFQWDTCGDPAIARAVVLYRGGKPIKDDNHGHRPACPVSPSNDGSCDLSAWRAGRNGAIFAPQGGLRISMRDLARIGRMLLDNGRLDGIRLLSPASVRLMETPAWTYDGNNGDVASDTGDDGMMCSYGLGMMLNSTKREGCRDDLFGDGRPRMGHRGSAYDLKSGLWIDHDAGTGVVFFATGVASEKGGHSAFNPTEESLARP